MKYYIIVIWIAISLDLRAQYNFPFKENFEQKLEPYYTSAALSYNNTSIAWWENWGWILESYLKMYETTGDKAYLNKFIKHSYGVLLRRGTSDIWDGPMSGVDPTIVLYTGPMLRPMAEYVYIVKNNTTLYNTNLISGIIPGVIDSYTMLGYGDYANWLQGEVTAALDKINDDYWINDDKCYSKVKLSSCQKNCASHNCSGSTCTFCNCPPEIEINFNSSYAGAMFFIGSVNAARSDLTAKAANIVDYFKNGVTEYTPNQSYTWFHNPDGLREDVVHGAMDIQIPLVTQQLSGSTYYGSSEMTKFAHTFSRNIWDRYNQTFHNNVFGTDVDCSADQSVCGGTIPVNGTPNFYGPGEVLAWMSLASYDDEISPDDIYTVLITQAWKLLEDDPTAFLPAGYCTSVTRNLSGGVSFLGLSEVTKEQWRRECVDLTLYNRDLNYSQDFDVRNSILVAPGQTDNLHSSGQESFADPVTTNNTFVVRDNVICNMTAGETITLLPGFSTESGAYFSATISVGMCTDGRSMGTIANNGQVEDQITNAELKPMIYPNPFSNTVSVAMPENLKGDIKIEIFDLSGRIVHSEILSNTKTRSLDLSNFRSGMYFIKVTDGYQIFTEKIIKQ